MMRRVNTAATTRAAMGLSVVCPMRCRSEGLADAGVNPMNQRLSDGIGKGTPIPLKFDYFKPVYMVPSWPEQVTMMILFFTHNNLWRALFSATCVWAFHGGFSGVLPPDAQSLFP